MIWQGEVYWVDAGEPRGSILAGRRPFVVIQNNAVNRSGIRTVMMCPITTNLRRAAFRGNVRLDAGEGGLSDPSVVNVSQARVVDSALLARPIGRLPERRVREIIDGLNLLLTPRG